MLLDDFSHFDPCVIQLPFISNMQKLRSEKIAFTCSSDCRKSWTPEVATRENHTKPTKIGFKIIYCLLNLQNCISRNIAKKFATSLFAALQYLVSSSYVSF